METEGTGVDTGQAAEGTPSGTTSPAPTSTQGQPAGPAQTTAPQGTGAAGGEDSFFDPTTLDPSLLPAYKNMQKAFSKKMESIKESRTKIEAFDNFQKDPIGTMQSIARQYGYNLSRADAAAAVQAANQQVPDWQPQTWEEVMTKAEERAERRLLDKLGPVLGEIQQIKRSNIEKLLDDSCPDWRQYEDEMMQNLRRHPTLVSDPAKLYMMSVPGDVLESRATQKALQRLQAKSDANKAGGMSTTTKTQAQSAPASLSFSDAVKWAEARLAEQGIRKPGGG